MVLISCFNAVLTLLYYNMISWFLNTVEMDNVVTHTVKELAIREGKDSTGGA